MSPSTTSSFLEPTQSVSSSSSNDAAANDNEGGTVSMQQQPLHSTTEAAAETEAAVLASDAPHNHNNHGHDHYRTPSSSPDPVTDPSSPFVHHQQQEQEQGLVQQQPEPLQELQQPRPPQTKCSLSSCIKSSWTKFTFWLNHVILSFVVTTSLLAARNPKRCIGLIIVISISLLFAGFSTNFTMSVSEQDLLAPTNAVSRHYGQYLDEMNAWGSDTRPIMMIVHANGDNVVTYEAVDLFFRTIEEIRATSNYQQVCQHSSSKDLFTEEPECGINGITEFWYHNRTLFQQETQGSDQLTREYLSKDELPDGSPAFPHFMLGYYQRNETTGLIDYAKSIAGTLNFPKDLPGGLSDSFESDVIQNLQNAQDKWENNSNSSPDKKHSYEMEFLTLRSMADELVRAIYKDLPLVPLVFIIMALFCCVVFYRHDRVQSRTLLGLGSVVTILMSIMTGYGLLFCVGVPFTNMTQILPFVIFGIGLDDTFIITGAYFRTDPKKDPVERIEETMEEVGNSISLTTITTITAFCLGCVSSIPSIRWLCLYSFPTIAIDFVYQITFFAAIIVLDEQRVQANRRDCCICLTASPHGYDENKQLEDDDEDDDNDGGDGLANRRINHRRRAFRSPNRRRTKTEECCSSEDDSSCSYNQRQAPQAEAATTMQQKHQIVEEDVDDDTEEEEEEENIKAHIADRFMGWYADQLLRPTVKVCVLIAFAAFLAGCCFSATKLTQDFQAAEFLSDDSYALGFNMAGQLYREYSIRVPAYFRFVDQSNPEVQQQMQNYIDDLAALPQFGREPEICWFRDFQKLRHGTSDMFADYQYIFGEDMNFTFDEQIDIMLSVPEVKRLYGSQIARDGDGKIVLSRCSLTATNLDFNIVRDQVDALEDLYDLAAEQEVNEGLEPKDYRFFAYEGGMFFLWEFYTTAVKELTFTTITGVVAVSIIGFLLVPHWSSVLFVTPLTMVLYVNLLGTIQFAGLHINPLVYVCLVISIGLLVDFLMHIVLRYYESTGNTRDDKVKDTLKTMGASILVGGLSTCLGVIPLAFASSAVLRTVFVSFIAMVTLGVGHGLILLPVLLSYVGPTVSVRLNKHVILHEQKSLEDGDIVAATSKVAMSTTEEHEASDEPASVSGKAAEGEFGAPSHQGYPRSVTSDSSDAPLVLLNSPKISGASPQRNNKGTAEAAILAFMEEVSNASYAPVHQNIAAKEDDSDGEGDGAVEDRAEDAWILDVTPSTDSYINHVDC